MQKFSGFDAASPTLQASPRVGDCMRDIIDEKFRTTYTDRAIEIRSGDFVRLWIQYPDTFAAIVKRLRVSRAGTWWGECTDGVFQIGTLVRPFAIERVVAFSTEILIENPHYERRIAPEKQRAHYAMLAQEAGVTEEWATLGHLDGVPFPGLNRVNYLLGDGCTRNPEYCPPEQICCQ